MCNVQLTVELGSSILKYFLSNKVHLLCASLFFSTALTSLQLPTVDVLFEDVWVDVLIKFALHVMSLTSKEQL